MAQYLFWVKTQVVHGVYNGSSARAGSEARPGRERRPVGGRFRQLNRTPLFRLTPAFGLRSLRKNGYVPVGAEQQRRITSGAEASESELNRILKSCKVCTVRLD